jgi:hypothetical protein
VVGAFQPFVNLKVTGQRLFTWQFEEKHRVDVNDFSSRTYPTSTRHWVQLLHFAWLGAVELSLRENLTSYAGQGAQTHATACGW